MAIPERHGQIAGTYFVTSRTWQSRAIFTREPVCRVFVEALFQYRDKGAYRLHAFILMREHFHVLITPALEVTLERAVQYIKGGSAHRIRSELNFRWPVWQRGFSDHRIRDARDYETHIHYIEENAVRERLVSAAREYPWCSASGEYNLDEPPQGLKPVNLAAAIRHG